MASKNPNSILFIFEGYTEKEFYDKILDLFVPKRVISIKKHNLKGIFNINKKVRNSILRHLDEKKSEKQIHVFVAFDREGRRDKPTDFNIELIRKEFIKKGSRVVAVEEIIATQDLESWLFHDIDGIYSYLKIPKKKRQPDKYKNVELFNNKDLSKLFREANRIYFKRGNRVEGFIDSLSIKEIYHKVKELRKGIEYINSIC